MSRTYNMIGSLSTLKSHLEENNIYDFKSLKEVIDFQSSFTTKRQQLISHHENLIEQEKNKLKTELQLIDETIDSQKKLSEKALTDEIEKLQQQLCISTNSTSTNFFIKITQNFSQWILKRQLRQRERNFDTEVKKSLT